MLIHELVKTFSIEHRLPESFEKTALEHFVPLAESLFHAAQSKTGQPLFVGIHGCQGSGKSTLTDLLLFLFEHHYRLPGLGMSIDDFYLTKAERVSLSQTVHPLFKTRGVPGTHDIALLSETFAALSENRMPVRVPVFNKAADDRVPKSEWRIVEAPVAIVILEGWCVSVPSQSVAGLETPINDLESNEDQQGVWRKFVNTALEDRYQQVFSHLNPLVMLKPPSFSAVKGWRLEQEVRLRDKLTRENKDVSALMSEAEIDRFVQHYQRLTEYAIEQLPSIADYVFELDEARKIVSFKQQEATL